MSLLTWYLQPIVDFFVGTYQSDGLVPQEHDFAKMLTRAPEQFCFVSPKIKSVAFARLFRPLENSSDK